MRGQSVRIAGRILTAVVVGGTAVLVAASPGHAATTTATPTYKTISKQSAADPGF
jgi:hypothetical protein